MTIETGNALLVKLRVADDAAYETIAGVRAKTIIFNANPLDMTSADSAGQWRELLAGGIRDIRIEGQGLFTNAASDHLFREMFFNGTHPDCQIIVPRYGTISGRFAIAELQYLGEYDGEMSWQIELHSSGEMSFVAV